MPTAEDFRQELYRIFYKAFKQGKATIEVSAGELHRMVGNYPGRDHRMPDCCNVMRQGFAPDAGDSILSEPPSRQGATLTILYSLPGRMNPYSGKDKATA